MLCHIYIYDVYYICCVCGLCMYIYICIVYFCYIIIDNITWAIHNNANLSV